METSKVSWKEIDIDLSLEVKKIRKILLKLQIELPNHCDGFITRCIRLQDGNFNKAVALVQKFQRTIAELISWKVSIYPSAYHDLYMSGFVIPVKTPSHRIGLNSRIFIVQTRLWDPNRMSFDEILISLWMLTQYVQINFVDTQTNGFEVIWDFSHFSFQQAWSVNHFKLIKVMKWMQDKAAGRFKQLHIIFHPRIVGVLYNGIKPFLKEKLKKRIILHGDSVESLHQHVDPMCLPKYLGGPWPSEFNEANGCVDDTVFKGLFLSDDFFMDMVKFGFPSQ